MSYDAISAYVWEKLDKYLHPSEIQAISWNNKTRQIPAVIRLKNGSKIICKSYDQGREKFQGASVFVVWLDEEPPEDIYNECIARTIDCRGRIILTMTPLKGLSWTYDRIFMYEPPDDWPIDTPHEVKYWTVSLLENKYIGDEGKQIAMRLYSVDELEQRINGLFRQMEGAVWKEFDISANLIPRFPIPRHWRRIRAIDFGYNHPFVCLWMAMDNEENVYVYTEYVQSSTLLQDHADNMRTLDSYGLSPEDEQGDRGIENSVSDHAAQDRAELVRYKILTVPANKEVILGVQIVNRMFKKRVDHPEKKPRLLIFNDLKQTIKQLREYHYPKKKITELPNKVNDDTQDAMRYGVMYFVSIMSRPPVVLYSPPPEETVAPTSLSLVSPARTRATLLFGR